MEFETKLVLRNGGSMRNCKYEMTVTKSFEFDGAHKLGNSGWSEEKNREVFGKCCNLHGHRWTLYVTVKGFIDVDTGMVINFSDLSRIVKENVIEVLDHKYLNDFIVLPTCENILTDIWNILKPKLSGLEELKLYETPTAYAIYDGKETVEKLDIHPEE